LPPNQYSIGTRIHDFIRDNNDTFNGEIRLLDMFNALTIEFKPINVLKVLADTNVIPSLSLSSEIMLSNDYEEYIGVERENIEETESKLSSEVKKVNVYEELLKHKTEVVDDLNFSWATDDIRIYEERPILHMAGVTDNLKHIKFYKGEYINVDPIKRLESNPSHFDYIESNSTTIKYVEVMKSFIQKTKN
jgi:hypothetical protein